jgi:hypothetical protein
VFYRRTSGDHDPWLREKIWVFVAGAVAAMIGMLLDNSWVLVGAGILLAAGVLLRFVPRGGDDDAAPDPPYDDGP